LYQRESARLIEHVNRSESQANRVMNSSDINFDNGKKGKKSRQ